MNILMTTRFNNNTWTENKLWRDENSFDGCIYNTPTYIKENIPLLETLFVIEMNNDTNKILGFGMINNRVRTNQRYRVHDDRNYNRHTYKGKQRIDIKDITQPEIMEQIEKLQDKLFKSKSHFKRGQGLQTLSDNLTKEYFKPIASLF